MFTARIDMENPLQYAPIEIYAGVLRDISDGLIQKGKSAWLINKKGVHSAMMVWVLVYEADLDMRLEKVFEVAASHLYRVEQLYAERMVYIDKNSPWKAVAHFGESRGPDSWEKSKLSEAGIELVRPVGMGGTSSTWEAIDRTKNVQVLVKFLAPDLRFGDYKYMRRRFWKEYKIGRQLSQYEWCPNFFRYGRLGERRYYCQQFIRGVSLRDWKPKQGDVLRRKQNVLNRLIMAVGEMHRHGVLHRDLSPKNVLVTSTDKVFLIDLGTATFVEHADGNLLTATTITLPKDHFGSLKYAAPEVWDSAFEHSKKSDVYSVGVIAYELLLERSVAGNVQPLSDFGLDIDERLNAFAFAARSFDPNQRPEASNYINT
jgi:serine/threonine protein kinase